MTAFNPNHPDVKKKVEKYISASLGLSLDFILALPIKGGGRTLPWKVELANGDKQLFIILKTPNLEENNISGDKYDFFRQYRLLKQLETTKLKTPKVWGANEKGTALGIPCFLEESLKGRTLYNSLKIKEKWADELYIKSIIDIQKIKSEELGAVAKELGEGTKIKYMFFNIEKEIKQLTKGPLISSVLDKLNAGVPEALPFCFGNGDFNPKNFLAKDKQLAGILDFECAGCFDPLYEFLFPLEKYPLLKNRGLEEEYCGQMGFKNKNIEWYRGLILITKLLESLKDEKSSKPVENEERNIKEETLAELSKWTKEADACPPII
ncbi:MAG: hypothetical protein A2231_04000 [Candidatus Firestonebacteria bacterium RIFOXYA2_FULL_40_8]|nr:MAG: hypothetical protein A2231_04000 [Candidatus Firestonebacteria bacterium RIFOXYA2_FULL_40_8]